MSKTRGRTSGVYTVEKLIDRRGKTSKVEYLVKWKNWSEKHNTWEPEKNILDKQLIVNFQRRQKQNKSARLASPSKVSAASSPLPPPPSAAQPPANILAVPPTPFPEEPSEPQETAVTEEEQVTKKEPPKIPAEKPLSVSVTPPPQLPSSSDDAKSSPATPAIVSTPSQHSGSSSVGAPMPLSTPASPPVISPPAATSTDEPASPSGSDSRSVDSRLRQTTLLVTAASASAAHAAANLVKSTSPKLKRPPNFLRLHSVPDSACDYDERPKIRLTIPRERLLCPSHGVNFNDFSSPHFRAPVELPRRQQVTVDGDAGHEDDDDGTCLPKYMARIPEIEGIEVDCHNASEHYKHRRSEEKKKRKKKRRESSGGSKHHPSSSSTTSSQSSISPKCESPRRLAPLRIQLPRAGCQAPILLLPPCNYYSSKRVQIDRDISVTDVTVGGLTITIKECSTPKNFFGVPSSQVVHRRVPLTPRTVAPSPQHKDALSSAPHNKQNTNVLDNENIEPDNSQLSVILEGPSGEESMAVDTSITKIVDDKEVTTPAFSPAKQTSPVKVISVSTRSKSKRGKRCSGGGAGRYSSVSMASKQTRLAQPTTKRSQLPKLSIPSCTSIAENVYTFHGESPPLITTPTFNCMPSLESPKTPQPQSQQQPHSSPPQLVPSTLPIDSQALLCLQPQVSVTYPMNAAQAMLNFLTAVTSGSTELCPPPPPPPPTDFSWPPMAHICPPPLMPADFVNDYSQDMPIDLSAKR